MALSGEGPFTVAWQPRGLETLPAWGPWPFIQPVLLATWAIGTFCLTIAGPGLRHPTGGRRRRVGEVEQAPIVMSSVGPPSAAACRRTERGVPTVIVLCDM